MAETRGGRPIAASQRPTGGDKAIATGKKQYFRRKKVCRFCVEKIDDINYKDIKNAGQLRFRTRQNYSAPDFGRLHTPSEAACAKRSSRRVTSPCCRSRRAGIGRRIRTSWKSFSEKKSRNWDTAARMVKVADGYARNYLLPKKLAVARQNPTEKSSSRSARRGCAKKPN